MLFTGIASQAIGGTAFTRFENISINNNSGVLLQQDAVTNTLHLLRGPFILNKRALTVINSNPKAIIRNSGYLVREQVDNTGRVIWNMGNTYRHPCCTVLGNYIPFTFNLTTGTIGNVTVATYPTNMTNQVYPVTPDRVTNANGCDGKDNSSNTVDRFWQISKDGASSTATVPGVTNFVF